MKEKYLAKVNPKFFQAISLFAGNNDVRYYLNGVCIDPNPKGGVNIVATNGHILAVMHDENGFAKEQIVVARPSKSLLGACKTRNKSPLTPGSIWFSNNLAVVKPHVDDDEENNKAPNIFNDFNMFVGQTDILLQAKYPNYTHLMKPINTKNKSLNFFNGNYINLLNKALLILDGKNECISIKQGDSKDPCLCYITGEYANNFIAVLMPKSSELMPSNEIPQYLQAAS